LRSLVLMSVVAAGVMSAGASAQAADLMFKFDAKASSITIKNDNPICLPHGGCKLSAKLAKPFPTFSLDAVGDSETFDFANFNIGAGFGFASDVEVDAVLAFVDPVVGDATATGSASYVEIGGLFTGGSLVWNEPSQFTAPDGSLFTVNFQDLSGLKLGSKTADDVTITLDRLGPAKDPASGPAAVPEPASWALMIGGFGLAGVALRRRQAQLQATVA
jgi:PEP-CTERM motif